MWAARKLLASAVALLPNEDAARLLPKLDDALFETGASRRRPSVASLRCFWRRPFGHRWEIQESAGRPMLRCVNCGRAKGGPWGLKYLIDKPRHSGYLGGTLPSPSAGGGVDGGGAGPGG